MPIQVHPTAVVDPKARLEEDVFVGPFCVVGPDVRIGPRTRLRSHVSITGHTTLGSDNDLYPFVVVGSEPQDSGYHQEPTRVEIGDRNILREAVTIHRGTTKEDGLTRVGSDNFIMGGCHIAHDCKVGSRISMANGTVLGGHVHVHDFASLSGLVAVHHFCSVGSYSFVGGLSRINMDAPPYMLVEGHPMLIRSVNLVGLKRRGFTPLEIQSLTEAHRLIYRMRMAAPQAREILIDHDHWTDPIIKLFEFLDQQRTGRFGRAREQTRMAA